MEENNIEDKITTQPSNTNEKTESNNKKEISININRKYITVILISILLGVATVAAIAKITFSAWPCNIYRQYYETFYVYSFFDSRKVVEHSVFNKDYQAYAEAYAKYEEEAIKNHEDPESLETIMACQLLGKYPKIRVNPSESDLLGVYFAYLYKGIEFYYYLLFITLYAIVILFFLKFKLNIKIK